MVNLYKITACFMLDTGDLLGQISWPNFILCDTNTGSVVRTHNEDKHLSFPIICLGQFGSVLYLFFLYITRAKASKRSNNIVFQKLLSICTCRLSNPLNITFTFQISKPCGVVVVDAQKLLPSCFQLGLLADCILNRLSRKYSDIIGVNHYSSMRML